MSTLSEYLKMPLLVATTRVNISHFGGEPPDLASPGLKETTRNETGR